MCGIAGFFSLNQKVEEFYIDHIKKMTDMITHRGPDDGGYWLDVENHLAFGHRRLSIIDLNPTGHQPMLSSDGRFVIVYNGEIYNYLELKKELDAAITTAWRGHSDTEVLLRCFELWGVKKTLEKACGMFALALFDRKEKKLVLARDRIGEKPLYYGWLDDIFFFGSELKVMRGVDAKKPAISMEALGAYFRYGYIPAPYSIFQGVKKVSPGTYIEIDIAKLKSKSEPKINYYWEARNYFNFNEQRDLSLPDAQNQLEQILENVVRQTLISDVPIGAFLSGGIDSSLIVALMQKVNPGKTKTFTIGFYEDEFNEAQHALAISKHLGTDHTELYLTPKDSFDVIPKLSGMYDEPFADSSQIPTFLVSALTKTKVKVALSGDGGDELFAGYSRYLMAKKMVDLKHFLPEKINQFLAAIILSLPNLAEYDSKILGSLGVARMWYLGRRVASVLKDPANKIYESMISQWSLDSGMVAHDVWQSILQDMYPLKNADIISHMMYVDMMSYLPDDIMVKVDRAAMAVSLETRAPFLDRRVLEFVLSLPLYMKIKGGYTKNILKNILYKYVPRDLLERPKQGFGVPMGDWLRGPLKEWASDLLSREMLAKHNYLNIDLIEKTWCDHLSCRQGKNFMYSLWVVLMFQSWYHEVY